jgi:hypothetical protein
MKPTSARKQNRAASLVPLTEAALAQVRGGNSGPSDSNRIIERHELPGNQAAAADPLP